MDKLVITVAPVGAEVTREQNPNIPLTPEEIAQEVERACRAGAAMVHLHARDEQGNATQDGDVYREIAGHVRERCDIIIQVSTGGAVGMTREERAGSLKCGPEMATLTTGTVNFGDDVFLNTLADMKFFAQAIAEVGAKPEIEVFDAGFIKNAMYLVKKGLIKEPLHFDFVMNVPGGIPGTPRNLLHLAGSIPEGSTWSVAGIGRTQLPLAVMAIILGGHVRVGFEDNIFYKRGVLAGSNAELVGRVVRVARELGREIATPEEARQILGLTG